MSICRVGQAGALGEAAANITPEALQGHLEGVSARPKAGHLSHHGHASQLQHTPKQGTMLPFSPAAKSVRPISAAHAADRKTNQQELWSRHALRPGDAAKQADPPGRDPRSDPLTGRLLHCNEQHSRWARIQNCPSQCHAGCCTGSKSTYAQGDFMVSLL